MDIHMHIFYFKVYSMKQIPGWKKIQSVSFNSLYKTQPKKGVSNIQVLLPSVDIVIRKISEVYSDYKYLCCKEEYEKYDRLLLSPDTFCPRYFCDCCLGEANMPTWFENFCPPVVTGPCSGEGRK